MGTEINRNRRVETSCVWEPKPHLPDRAYHRDIEAAPRKPPSKLPVKTRLRVLQRIEYKWRFDLPKCSTVMHA
jgi:5-methylcytosine-specific restriction endonuclease McrA